jgi:hypothetical protein
MKKFLKLLREPLFLFFFFGFLIFFLYTRISNLVEQKNSQIIVSAEQIELLAETFTKTWNRTPTKDELISQIDNYVMDEIFFKEAVAMGLDKTDQAVKRRMRQLMEMMLDDYASVYPSEAELRDYLSENHDKFRLDPKISFRHIHFPMGEKQKATDLLPGIQNGSIRAEIYSGSMVMVPDQFTKESRWQVKRVFGDLFTERIFQLEEGIWQGPVESAYGWHLVKIAQRTEGEVPDLNEIWDQVEREWSFDMRRKIKEEQYQKMRESYHITIENGD